MNNSKVAVAVSKTASIIQLVAGLAVILMFGMCTIMYLVDKEFADDVGASFLVFTLVMDAIGIWLISLSRKKSKLLKDFKKYVAVISNSSDGYIPDVAESLGTSENIVRGNLEKMIKKKFFSNAFIDQKSNCIVIARRNAENAASNNSQSKTNVPNTVNKVVVNEAASASVPEMVTVKCTGCGAINTIIKGQVGECDYCGSVIKGE